MVGVHMIIKTMAAKTSEMEVLRQGHGVCRSQIQRIKFDIYDMVLLPYVWAPNFGAIQDFHAIQQRIYIKRCHWILKWQANSYIGSIGSGFGLCKLLRHNPCESSEVESQPRPIVTHIHPSLWDRSNTSIEPCMYCIYIYVQDSSLHACFWICIDLFYNPLYQRFRYLENWETDKCFKGQPGDSTKLARSTGFLVELRSNLEQAPSRRSKGHLVQAWPKKLADWLVAGVPSFDCCGFDGNYVVGKCWEQYAISKSIAMKKNI